PVSDLGKFGMGLVTAGLSIARRTTVVTKQGDKYLTAIADVDEVVRSNRFDKYLNEASQQERDLLDNVLQDSESGTIVMLDKCDGLKNQNTTQFASILRRHLGRVHRYFLRAEKKMTVNAEKIDVLDPLELDGPDTVQFSDEVYPIIIKGFDGERVENVRARIVLIPETPASGERDIALALKNQGFSILRNQREILHAETLDAFTKHNDFNRMRGEVFLTGDLDQVVGIDFTKRSIVFEQSFKDQLLKHLKPQCSTIKARERARQSIKENPEVDDLHREAQKSIDQKAKLLVTPKTEIERRGPRNGISKDKTEPKEKTLRSRFRLVQPADAHRCKFEYAKLGPNGQIYECEMIGRTIVIQWNVQHPFYQRFILDQRSDGRLVTAIDFLVYSMASAELTVSSDDNLDVLSALKSIISSNMRTLLS
ncbi:MAG: hypothetical protein NT028_08295, partial [candidate division Zixibacteria bacterium]|nr:hypothetical protein [candidate division Zixibacteria bacterium]